MYILRRALQVYRQEGAKTLARKGWRFAVWEFFPEKILWRVLPEAKTKSLISRSRLLTTVYFYIRGSFYHEQRTILQGQNKYIRNETGRADPVYKLIRNTHRIEKGLSMKDRRDVFAEGYIEDLVDIVQLAWLGKSSISDEQLHWATDVLARYFEVVEHTQTIERAYTQFAELLESIEYTPDNRVPMERRELEGTQLNLSLSSIWPDKEAVRGGLNRNKYRMSSLIKL